MGDRRNVIIKEGKSVGVSLYSHWGGTELPETVKRALARGLRWGDSAYLARIIFSEMIGDEKTLKMETGFGISAADNMCEADEDHDIVVDVVKQTVRIGKAKAVSFNKYIE